jgi:hypothetical protein
MHRVGFGIDLHARGLVIVERAAEHFARVGFQSVMVEHLGDGELGFDFCYLHTMKNIFFRNYRTQN